MGEGPRPGFLSLSTIFFFKTSFRWIIFKVFIEFATILLWFYVLVFGHEAGGILAPRPGIEPTPPALEGEVLITGSAGKSLAFSLTHFLELKRRFGLF